MDRPCLVGPFAGIKQSLSQSTNCQAVRQIALSAILGHQAGSAQGLESSGVRAGGDNAQKSNSLTHVVGIRGLHPSVAIPEGRAPMGSLFE